MGPASPGYAYHPVLLARPSLDAADPMCHVYVEESDVLWTSGPSWLDLGNSATGEAALLQQHWAPLLTPSLPSRVCCLASPGIAGRRSAVQGAMRVPRSRFRCAASAAAGSSSLLPLPFTPGCLGGISVVGAAGWWWGAPGCFGKVGLAVGLWGLGLARGPLLL